MSTAAQLREIRNRRKMRHECIHCGGKLERGYLWFTCPNCREERSVLRYGSRSTYTSSKNPKWLALEAAERCPKCSLLMPCGGHAPIEFYASQRRGEATG